MSAEALLDAGAVLPAGAEVVKDDTVDTLTARTYRHPALDDRAVVRLVPGTLGGAEDLSLEFLAFSAPERVDEVGLVRQQALGFPAWALVHDPANGHHALALVKDIEKLARTAQSRVGPANEGFVALGERLGRSVPHFLPTFFEEAGRAFLAADSPSYAAMMFGRARDAERTYGLAIDEERTHAVFLEFALAGALTAKALSAHARDLASRCEPADAYERFRRLCVERTLGGLPPYAGMHTDLRRLAKAAKLDQATADGQVLAELLDAPAALRAAGAFWTAYQGPLGQRAAQDPALRARLLEVFPDNCPDDVWLAILETSGAIGLLTEPDTGADPADWLTRFAAHREGRSYRYTERLPGLPALVQRLAPRLIADGTPVKLAGENDDVDIDLLDACLGYGVPVADPHKDARYPVGQWLEDATEGRRDLVALASDERFRRRLANAMEASLGGGFDAASIDRVLAVPGLRLALHGWLDDVAESALRQGLPNLRGELDRLTRVASPAGFAVNPEAVRRVADHDLGPVLGRTLRAGVLDEYGWPAWEEAVRRLPELKDRDKLSFVSQWPVLVLRGGSQVFAIGPDRIEAEHVTAIPKGQRSWLWRLVLRYVDGQLLVCWDKGPDRAGYWTGDPDQVFVVPDEAFSLRAKETFCVALPGGGRTAGGRPLHPGDRAEERLGHVVSDGTTYWRRETVDREEVWREYDPATGTAGTVSTPPFLAEGSGWFAPLAGSADGDPLGRRDGLVGWRLTDPKTRSGTGIDGREFVAPARTRGLAGQLTGALRFPGSDALYGVLRETGWNSETVTLCTADGFTVGRYDLGVPKQRFARGTLMVPLVQYWHHLRPRDPRGSAALRAVTDATAGELLAGAAGLDRAGITELVARTLPELTDPALLAGVAGVVKQAAKRAATLREFATVLSGQSVYPKPVKGEAAEPVAAEPANPASDEALAAAMEGMLRWCSRRGHSGLQLVRAAVAALTDAEPPAGQWLPANTDVDWVDLLGLLPAAMYRAVAPATAPAQREALLVLLETYAGSGLAPGGSIRRVSMTAPNEASAPKHGTVLRLGAARFAVLRAYGTHVNAVQYAPDGQFPDTPDWTVAPEWSVTLPDGAAELVRRVREDGPPQWDDALATRLAHAVGVSHAEAVYVLAGLRGDADSTPGLSQALRQAADWAWRYTYQLANLPAMLLPDDLATLWTEGPALDAIAEWHTEAYGRRKPIPDELLDAVQRAHISGSMSSSELLHGLANPETCKWLSGNDSYVNADKVTTTLARALPWLGYHLAPADPLRANLSVVARRGRELLLDPAREVSAGYLDERKVDRFIGALGLAAHPAGEWTEVGPVLIKAADETRTVRVRPGRLSGPDDPILGALRAWLGESREDSFTAVRLLLSGTLDESVASGQSTVDDPHNPPAELVTEVAGALGVGTDAAALYLQLLALPDPTDRNVARWTGWKPARLGAARKELAASGHVVEAKRSRAGRSLFLPGGWLALRAPHLPVERWKIPLLTLDEDGRPALDVVVPVAPLSRLFALAWQRVADGDRPRFDDVERSR